MLQLTRESDQKTHLDNESFFFFIQSDQTVIVLYRFLLSLSSACMIVHFFFIFILCLFQKELDQKIIGLSYALVFTCKCKASVTHTLINMRLFMRDALNSI